MNCILCKDEKLIKFYANKYGKCVTSDNKIYNYKFEIYQCQNCLALQKKTTNDFFKKIENIYSNYNSYYLSDGQEEFKILNDDTITGRSRIIINNLENLFSNRGKLLDIGTGNGVFLKEFSSLHTGWSLYAQDVNLNSLKQLEKINGFQKMFTLEQYLQSEDTFDVISCIHVFEHIVEIDQFLENIKNKLVCNGVLIIQVPNIDENIFDMFILDHIIHFSRYTIYNLLSKYFNYVVVPKGQIEKEITVICSNNKIEHVDAIKIEKNQNDNNKKEFLNEINTFFTKKSSKIAIFGTTPAALVCANMLNFKIEYFIDESNIKVNKKLYNINIINPEDVANEVEVLFPYSLKLYTIIRTKYPQLKLYYLGIN